MGDGARGPAKHSGSIGISRSATHPRLSIGGGRQDRATCSCANASGRPPTRSGFGSTCRRRCISARALSQTSKAERAIVLALALATLLSDAGERVGIPTLMEAESAAQHRNGHDGDARAFALRVCEGLPNAKNRLSRHSEMVIFSDFLEPESAWQQVFNEFAVQGVRGHLMQILDPAEESLPYQGRVEFIDAENGARYVAERAETLRAEVPEKARRA